MHTLESLPVEIFDLILQAVKDDATLQAAVLSCTKFHAAHHHHQLAINAQVLRNAFGGQLSIGAMIRSVRVESAVYEGQAQTARLDEFLDRIRPYKEDLNSVPTPDEYELCTERTRVVEQLEIVYSRCHKNSTEGAASCLSFEESDRFRSAIHRLWLLGVFVTSMRRFCIDSATRVPLFYGDYTAQDVYDIHRVLDWLVDLVRNCRTPRSRRFKARLDRTSCLCAGPAEVLDAYERGDVPYNRHEELFQVIAATDAWADDVLQVFIKHQLLSPTETQIQIPAEIKPIVVAPGSQFLVCALGHKCNAKAPIPLWNESTWKNLPRKFRLQDLPEWFKGSLGCNSVERALLLDYLGVAQVMHAGIKPVPVSTMTLASVLHAFYNLPATAKDNHHQQLLAKTKFRAVTSKDFLCENCLAEFVEDHLWLWWATVKKRVPPKNESVLRDCRFGYQCTLQITQPRHVPIFNHACLRTHPMRKKSARRQDKRTAGLDSDHETEDDGGEDNATPSASA